MPASSDKIDTFIERWSPSGGAERANYQMFLAELADLLGVPRPDPSTPDNAENAYVFDRSFQRTESDGSTATNYIDLYRRGHFICETKQGVEAKIKKGLIKATQLKTGHGQRGTSRWDTAMERAFKQAEGYAHSLPPEEGRPPFILVMDVGYSIELFSEFSCTGGTYVRFPSPTKHRFLLNDLRNEQSRETLRQVWADPHSLDPAKHSAKVTRAIADHLAKLAKSLEADGHDPQIVADFLMRSIFTMFAEDIGLLPKDSFTELLRRLKKNIRGFPVEVQSLWRDMANGTDYSMAIREKVIHFNGGLFEHSKALPVSDEQLDLLIAAAEADWREVEPAIFGTLLERALSPRERHKLGAHYTPRAYVERLVFPTVINPLREEWAAVKTAVAKLQADVAQVDEQTETLNTQSEAVIKSGDAKAAKKLGKEIAKLKSKAAKTHSEALATLRAFHHQLCQIRVLDPACGSGNFLYVTMEHMKRLEGEVLELLTRLGDPQLEAEMRDFKVRPHQFIGLEINLWAVPIAELVLWIGYLQWHFRTSDKALPDDPVISKQHSIQHQDAVLAYDRKTLLTDEQGIPVTHWDGRTTKPHPVTGNEVPDETVRVPVYQFENPRPAEWPDADFIVGNPPFIGASLMRDALGNGYTETLRQAYPKLPESCDYVLYWWDKAAALVRAGAARQFGFITTNSLRQTFNRRVVQPHLDAKQPLSLVFAVPDHPWVDSADGAAVRIAMTVGREGDGDGQLATVAAERESPHGEVAVQLDRREGRIFANLQIGANVAAAVPLQANDDLSCPGVKLHGSGFIVTPEVAKALGLGRVPGLEQHIRHYRNGRDLTATPRGVMASTSSASPPTKCAANSPRYINTSPNT